ncbi:MAG: cytosine deaminase [Rhodospirillales bacterium]|nr:cytosine deaminase [Rhodospirillales bacterium]
MKIDLPQNGSAHRPGSTTLASSPRRSWGSIIRAAFLVRRERWTLTWTGKLLVLLVVAALTAAIGRGACSFLAITNPIGGQFLVVEGWMPSYAYREAAAQFRKGGYQKAIAAGTLDWDASGELRRHSGGDGLVRFGIPGELVVTTSSDEVLYDRTFHAAMAVKRWLQDQGLRTTSIDIVTIGPHARRSRLLYEKALGAEVKVGVIAIEDRRFDANHWWRSSVGVRTVMGEAIAYMYVRLFFWASQ